MKEKAANFQTVGFVQVSEGFCAHEGSDCFFAQREPQGGVGCGVMLRFLAPANMVDAMPDVGWGKNRTTTGEAFPKH